MFSIELPAPPDCFLSDPGAGLLFEEPPDGSLVGLAVPVALDVPEVVVGLAELGVNVSFEPSVGKGEDGSIVHVASCVGQATGLTVAVSYADSETPLAEALAHCDFKLS